MTDPLAVPEFRYFKDDDGTRWKIPTSGLGGFRADCEGEWMPVVVPVSLSTFINCWTYQEAGTIETDATGAPLVPSPVTCEPAREGALTIEDYEHVLADHRRLVRELDVACFGDEAAPQASLCDLVKSIPAELDRLRGRIDEGWTAATIEAQRGNRLERETGELRAALEDSQELLVTCLHETGAAEYREQIEARCHANRTLLNKAQTALAKL